MFKLEAWIKLPQPNQLWLSDLADALVYSQELFIKQLEFWHFLVLLQEDKLKVTWQIFQIPDTLSPLGMEEKQL